MSRFTTPLLIAVCVMVVMSLAPEVVAADAQGQSSTPSGLPAALLAADVQPEEVVAEDEASEVRGQWWISVALPYGDMFYQGKGQPFAVTVTTTSWYNPNRILHLRFRVGK